MKFPYLNLDCTYEIVYLLGTLFFCFLQGVAKNQEPEAICGGVSFVRGGHYYSEGDELLIPCYFRRNINPMLVQTQFFLSLFCTPTETMWCVQRAP